MRVTPLHAGCWIEGSWGVYGVTRVIEIAQDNGWVVTDEDEFLVNLWKNGDGNNGEVPDIADDAEAWLNEHVAPEGFSFGWHDGEFFLWSDTDWEEVSA